MPHLSCTAICPREGGINQRNPGLLNLEGATGPDWFWLLTTTHPCILPLTFNSGATRDSWMRVWACVPLKTLLRPGPASHPFASPLDGDREGGASHLFPIHSDLFISSVILHFIHSASPPTLHPPPQPLSSPGLWSLGHYTVCMS